MCNSVIMILVDSVERTTHRDTLKGGAPATSSGHTLHTHSAGGTPAPSIWPQTHTLQYSSTLYLDTDTLCKGYSSTLYLDTDTLCKGYSSTLYLDTDTLCKGYSSTLYLDTDTLCKGYSRTLYLDTDTHSAVLQHPLSGHNQTLQGILQHPLSGHRHTLQGALQHPLSGNNQTSLKRSVSQPLSHRAQEGISGFAWDLSSEQSWSERDAGWHQTPEGWAASTPRHSAISRQTEPRLRQKQVCDHKFITSL